MAGRGTGGAQDALAQVVREEWGRLVALLLARSRRLDLVEDALADAVEAAARTWPEKGMPRNPAGWLMTAAQRRVIDKVRAETMARRRHTLIATDLDRRGPGPGELADPGDLVEDDVLRLGLMCLPGLHRWLCAGQRAGRPASPGSHRVAAVRAELLDRRGDWHAAVEVFDEAITLCRNDSEREHLVRRRVEVAAGEQ